MFKDDKGKPKLSLIPFDAMLEVVKVREYGIQKYKDDKGWKTVPAEMFAEAALRHTFKWLNGIDKDDESGLDHLSHAATSLMLAVAVLKLKKEE